MLTNGFHRKNAKNCSQREVDPGLSEFMNSSISRAIPVTLRGRLNFCALSTIAWLQ